MPTTRSQKRKASPAAQPAKIGAKYVKTKKQKAPEPAPNQTLKQPLIMVPTLPTSLSQHAGVAPLENLPDEVLLLIMEHMGAKSKNKQILYYNMSLTSRRLNRAANDCLYESFDNWEGDSGKFTRTLIQNAALAARVKILRWNCNIHALSYPPPKLTKPTSSDCCQLRESLQQLGIPTESRPQWLQLYSGGASADLLSVALLHTPNLKELMVNNSVVQSSDGYLRLLEHGMNGSLGTVLPDYSKIQTVDIIMDYKHSPPEGSVLPSVRNARTSFSSITNLTIANSYISSEAIVELVSSCRALSSFGLTAITERHPRETHPQQFYPPISEALERHKATLHTLVIDELSSRNLDGSDSHDRGTLSTFATYPKLHKLAFPFDGFAQVPPDSKVSEDSRLDLSTILPPLLQSLSITVYWEEATTFECSVALSDLAKVYRANFPHLSEVTMEISVRVYTDEIDFHSPGDAFLAEGLVMTVEQGDRRCPFREFMTGGDSEDYDRHPETGEYFDEVADWDVSKL